MDKKTYNEVLEVLDNQKTKEDNDLSLQYELDNLYINQLKEQYPTIYNGYKQIMDEQFLLFTKKHLSYGMDNISMGTQLSNPDEKKLSLTAVWIRMNDKMNRLKNLVLLNKKNTIEDESIEDSYKDLVNYGIIAQLVEKGLWKK